MSLPIPMWTATRTMLAVQSTHILFRWTALISAYLFSAILPVFYFALSRNGGALHLSRRLQRVSLAGALAGGMVMAGGLPEWLESSRPYLTTAKMLLSDLANLACIVLLVTLFRLTSEEARSDVSVPRFLAFATRVAVFAGGLWFTLNLIRLVLTPYAYRALQIGGTPAQSEADMIRGAVRTLLEQACLFTAPYLVYKSALRRG